MLKFNFKNYFNLLLLSFFSLFAITFTSCEKQDDEVVQPDPVPISFVSIHHASPNAPSVDILLDNRQINVYPLRYADFTGYLNFITGERNLRLRPENAANVIIDTTLTFIEGEAYSLFFVDELANIQAFLVEDEQVIPETGNAVVRFIHLSPDAPAVDVIVTGDENNVAFENRGYLQPTGFITVESGLQSFQIRGEGGNVLLSVPDVNLLSRGVYTLVIRGYLSPPPGNNNNLVAQFLLHN